MFLLVFFLFGVLRVIFLDYVLLMHVFALCFCLDSFVCFHEFVCWGWYPGVLSGISLFWIFAFCVFLLVCWGWYPWIMYGRRVEGTSRQTAALVRSHIFAVLVSYKSRPSVDFFAFSSGKQKNDLILVLACWSITRIIFVVPNNMYKSWRHQLLSFSLPSVQNLQL